MKVEQQEQEANALSECGHGLTDYLIICFRRVHAPLYAAAFQESLKSISITLSRKTINILGVLIIYNAITFSFCYAIIYLLLKFYYYYL